MVPSMIVLNWLPGIVLPEVGTAANSIVEPLERDFMTPAISSSFFTSLSYYSIKQ